MDDRPHIMGIDLAEPGSERAVIVHHGGGCDRCGKRMEYKTTPYCSFRCAVDQRVVWLRDVRTYWKWWKRDGRA